MGKSITMDDKIRMSLRRSTIPATETERAKKTGYQGDAIPVGISQELLDSGNPD